MSGFFLIKQAISKKYPEGLKSSGVSLASCVLDYASFFDILALSFSSK